MKKFRAPGRVNLIGEHTDYNDGFVMPVAINFSTFVDYYPSTDRTLRFHSDNFNEEVSFDLDNPLKEARGHWSDYPIGVALMLMRAGFQLEAARLVISSDVPIGSGLSSSAAIEVATALALTSNSTSVPDRTELAKLCRKAENEFVGARVGIMDQFVSLCGAQDSALLLDCRSLEFKLLPLATDAQLVICNTMVKHALASGAYNERRAQCEEGVRRLSTVLPGIEALRDLTSTELEQHKDVLPEVVYRRCRHIVTENERVLGAGEALVGGDTRKFGELMNASHESLRNDFEVSCEELDLMVGFAREVDGVLGARMTGGGFGGCTVNLVAPGQVEEFEAFVAGRYEEATKLKPEIYVCSAVNGAEEMK
ncbi:MAG TPA: galactokinase [Pyrinomonadaceae bacterium]